MVAVGHTRAVAGQRVTVVAVGLKRKRASAPRPTPRLRTPCRPQDGPSPAVIRRPVAIDAGEKVGQVVQGVASPVSRSLGPTVGLPGPPTPREIEDKAALGAIRPLRRVPVP